jgi:hypothetical protein
MLRLRALAALAALVAAGGVVLAGPDEGAVPAAPDLAGHGEAAPAERKLKLPVGDHIDFMAPAGAGERAQWTLDGAASGSGAAWTFSPTASDVGPHVVSVAGSDGGGRTMHRWDVRVTPPRLPRVTGFAPDASTLSVEIDKPIELRFDARPGTPGETVQVRWTVDGAFAGDGNTLLWASSEPANLRARAMAMGSFGGAVARDWLIMVRLPPPPTTTTEPATRAADAGPGEIAGPPGPQPAEQGRRGEEAPEPEARTEPAPEPVSPPTTEMARAETPTTEPPPTPPPPPPPPPPPSPPPPPPAPAPPPQAAVASRGTTAPAGADDEVRRLLDRYAAAWRNHDVGELRRIGQITSDSQAADLERYFAKVEDLDVEVHVLDIQNDGDRSTVRFTRRDRFRDPTGRMVSQESPPIEKHVVRAPDGLRFEPR